MVLANAKEIAPNDVLEVDCEILCPSALENSITLENVGRVKGKDHRRAGEWTDDSGRRSRP